jgi:hypothetical protein
MRLLFSADEQREGGKLVGGVPGEGRREKGEGRRAEGKGKAFVRLQSKQAY